jgi:hypothetical protein
MPPMRQGRHALPCSSDMAGFLLEFTHSMSGGPALGQVHFLSTA